MTKPASAKQTTEQAQALSKAVQRPGQTKEQTKLVAQGIQKGIDLYKKQQSTKGRALDKALKKAKQKPEVAIEKNNHGIDNPTLSGRAYLPWVLLALSWLVFAAYLGLR